jgi:hypothetical protein
MSCSENGYDDIELSAEAVEEIEQKLGGQRLKFLLTFDEKGQVASFVPRDGQGKATIFPFTATLVGLHALNYLVTRDSPEAVTICRWIGGEYKCTTY